jgi:hypothetical protein
LSYITALHYAIWQKREDLIGILVRAGANINIAGGKEKKTPYELALMQGLGHLVKKYKELYDWLKGIELDSQYVTFVKEEMFLEVIPDLNDEALDHMKINSTGHRMKLKKAAALLAQQQAEKEAAKKQATSATSTPKSDSKYESKTDDSTKRENSQDDLKSILLNLKHTNMGDQSWILDSKDLEYTEKLGSGTSGKVIQWQETVYQCSCRFTKDFIREPKKWLSKY